MFITINGKRLKAYDSMYYVSEYGDIYSLHSKKFLKWGIDTDGYPRVDIHGKHIKVHKLVYLTWITRDFDGLQINHLNDNKMNPSVYNLYRGTQKQNIRDCKDNGNRIGNLKYLTVFDKEVGQVLTFSPITEFIEYCGHPAANGSVKRMFSRNWFKKRYEIIDYSNVEGVTTKPDECKAVGGNK